MQKRLYNAMNTMKALYLFIQKLSVRVLVSWFHLVVDDCNPTFVENYSYQLLKVKMREILSLQSYFSIFSKMRESPAEYGRVGNYEIC